MLKTVLSLGAVSCALCAVRFQPNTDITAMMSVEGEVVPLKKRIKPSEAGGAVEKWLVQVRMYNLAFINSRTPIQTHQCR